MIIGYINGQSLQLHHGRVVEKTIDYLTAEFYFMTNEWDGFDKYAHFVNGEVHYKIKLTNNQVKKTDHLNLTAGVWKVYLHGISNTEIVTTNQCELTVEGTGDISGGEGADDIIQEAVKQAQEEYRNDLETSLETATGENYDGKTWEELNDTVAELPIITEEQTQALGDWDLIKDYFANLTTITHDLFRLVPVDEAGNSRRYSLPYIYTPKFAWNRQNRISAFIDEVGVDVSSSTAIGGVARGTAFSNLSTLKRLVLTGNKNQPSLNWSFYQNTALQYIKIETPSEEVLKANPSYYVAAFHSCESLMTIDCELDFTGQTSLENIFALCYKLKEIRIKSFTLSTSLDFGSCQVLHPSGSNDYDSLISILNAITLDREVAKNITLTFSSTTTDFTTDGGFWNCSVWWQDDGTYTLEEGNSVFVEPVSLYDAFITKGVTIAWK